MRMVLLHPQETSTSILPSIISPIWRRQVSRSQPLVIMMSFHSRRDVSKWVRDLQLNLCQGYFWKEESGQNLSSDDKGAKKHSIDMRKKKIVSIFIYSCLWQNCPIQRTSVRLNHKLEYLFRSVFIGGWAFMISQPTLCK